MIIKIIYIFSLSIHTIILGIVVLTGLRAWLKKITESDLKKRIRIFQKYFTGLYALTTLSIGLYAPVISKNTTTLIIQYFVFIAYVFWFLPKIEMERLKDEEK